LAVKLAAVEQSLKILLAPNLQIIGERCYQVAFIADPDGLPIEFLQNLGPA
jgi:hypothetical protein